MRCAADKLRICETNARAQLAANKPKLTAPPRSALLARAATFIPVLRSANAALPDTDAAEQPGAVEIQEVAEEEDAIRLHSNDSIDSLTDSTRDDCAAEDPHKPHAQHVEMDLACGVLDLPDAAAIAAAEAAAANGADVDGDLASAAQRAACVLPTVSTSSSSDESDESDSADGLHVVNVGAAACNPAMVSNKQATKRPPASHPANAPGSARSETNSSADFEVLQKDCNASEQQGLSEGAQRRALNAQQGADELRPKERNPKTHLLIEEC